MHALAERGDGQVGADFVATDLDQARAKIDLQLPARCRLEAHRCPRFRLQLAPVPLHSPLHRANADEDSLLGRQLLADDVVRPRARDFDRVKT